MDSRKVSLFATIAVIALVAVGIGFAYTAMTTNQGNTVEPQYLTIVQGETGAYQFAPAGQKVYWDSEDFKILTGSPYIGQGGIAENDFVTKFSLTGVTSITDIPVTGIETVQLGKPFTLTVKPTGTGAAAGGIDAKITAFNFSRYVGAVGATDIYLKATYDSTPANYQYFKLNTDNAFKKGTITAGEFSYVATEADNVLHFPKNDANTYKTVTVTVYLAATAAGIVEEHVSATPPVGPSTNPVNNATLSFRINASGANTPGGTALTGITVDTPTKSITGTGTANIVVTLAPGSASNQKINCVSSNADVATVGATYTGVSGTATVIVTGVTPGTCVITITSEEGSYTQEVVVTVNAAS